MTYHDVLASYLAHSKNGTAEFTIPGQQHRADVVVFDEPARTADIYEIKSASESEIRDGVAKVRGYAKSLSNAYSCNMHIVVFMPSNRVQRQKAMKAYRRVMQANSDIGIAWGWTPELPLPETVQFCDRTFEPMTLSAEMHTLFDRVDTMIKTSGGFVSPANQHYLVKLFSRWCQWRNDYAIQSVSYVDGHYVGHSEAISADVWLPSIAEAVKIWVQCDRHSWLCVPQNTIHFDTTGDLSYVA